jgi:phospholipase/carboxylesterase
MRPMNVLESAGAVIVEPDAPATAAVIWLHGLGADGYDFLPIVPNLNLAPRIAARFVFPHAPQRPVTLNGGMRMRAWYDLVSLNRTGTQDEAGVRASAVLVGGLVDAQLAAGVPRGRIVLAGFSQGGAVALYAGLRQSEALAGIMALSAYLPLGDRAEGEITPAGRATPILMCHGRQDQVLAFDMGTDSRDRLRALGVGVQWHEYPMGHEVCAAEISDISGWLRSRLGQA